MRKHNYLVGYRGDGQCLYGNQKLDYHFTNPLTLNQATRLSKKIYSLNGQNKIKSMVYKLVEMKNQPTNPK